MSITSTLVDGLMVYVPPVRVFAAPGTPFRQVCWIWFAKPATSEQEVEELSSPLPPQIEIAALPDLASVVQSIDGVSSSLGFCYD